MFPFTNGSCVITPAGARRTRLCEWAEETPVSAAGYVGCVCGVCTGVGYYMKIY